MHSVIFSNIENSAFGAAIASSEWMFPAIETIHVFAIVTVIGTIAIMDMRLLGWTSSPTAAAPAAGWGQVFEHQLGDPRDPAFLRAVDRFRFAAVALPAIFFLVTFAYLFAIRPLVELGVSGAVLLVLPVAGGGAMALWSAICRRRLVDAAERIEPGAARWGKEVAFTQSYWSGMRKEPAPWAGPLPRAAA